MVSHRPVREGAGPGRVSAGVARRERKKSTFLNELLHDLDEMSRVLDLGCGRGSFAYEACRARVLALDQWVADHAEARRRMAGGRVHYLLGTGLQLPLASGSMDLVVANHVFEHVEDPQHVAYEVSRVLKPTGLLFASVPDGFSFSDGLYRWCTRGGGHIQRYTFREFQRTVEAGTDLALLFACPLYTSFTFLNPTPTAARHLAWRYQTLALLPRVVREGVLRGMNRVSRAADALLRTRLSLYGWAFYFGKPGALLRTLPEELFINVCAFCGCGHSGAWLQVMHKVQRRYGFSTFQCEVCGRRNPYFGSPYIRRILGNKPMDAELVYPGSAPMPLNGSPPARSAAPHIEAVGDALRSSSALAPGTLVAISGETFTSEIKSAGDGPWPYELGGIRVLVNGQPAPLGGVSPSRIVLQLPFSTPRGAASFRVCSETGQSQEVEIAISLTAPSLPSENGSGSGQGKFSHSSWEPVTSGHPATPGECLTFWAAGLGPVVPLVEAGRPAPANPLSRTTRRALVRIGDQAADVEYCGLAPGAIGFYQVNARLPKKLAPDEHQVMLEIGGARSNVVTIPVGRK